MIIWPMTDKNSSVADTSKKNEAYFQVFSLTLGGRLH